jgi:hypothetical protein
MERKRFLPSGTSHLGFLRYVKNVLQFCRFFVLGLTFLILFLVASGGGKSEASINKAFNYQAKLLTLATNEPVADTNYNVIFSIYDDLTAGNCLWTSRGTCGTPTAKTVGTVNGIFSTILVESGDNAMT